MIEKHPEWLSGTRTFKGTIQYGMDLDSETRDKVAQLSGDLTENFAIVADGKRPDLQLALSMTGLGVVLLLIVGGGVAYVALRN